MYAVNYHRATSISEAAELAKKGDAKFLSGGMTLIPAMKTRLAAPSDVIDLGHIPAMTGITVAGKSVIIAAGTTHHDVSRHEKLREVCPAFADLASHIGDPHVRHKGTIGGSIANNDPAADYPAALLALDATVVTDQREIPASDFFTGLFETALNEGEIVTAVKFTAATQAAYEKFRNPASRYAIVGVFVAKSEGGVRVAVTGAGDNGVFRAKEIEAALATSFSPTALDGIKVPPGNLMGDIHATPEYRANLIAVLAKRAVAKAAA